MSLFPKLVASLQARGFTGEQIEVVNQEICKGLVEAELKIESGSIVAGKCEIKFLNHLGGEVMLPGEPIRKQYWEAKIGSMPPIQIRSIKIPELRYDEAGVLTFDVCLYPEPPDVKLFKPKVEEDKK